MVDHYRIFLLDHAGHIRGREEYEAKDDTEAITTARNIFIKRPHHSAFEVWQRARLVYREPR